MLFSLLLFIIFVVVVIMVTSIVIVVVVAAVVVDIVFISNFKHSFSFFFFPFLSTTLLCFVLLSTS